jgi:hypothetical protein
MPINPALPNASIPDEKEAIRGNNAVENAESAKKITYLVARRDLIGSFPGPCRTLYSNSGNGNRPLLLDQEQVVLVSANY